ncbi:MAG TPA: glycosyltransferase [Candidatus Saccharimonadales bacterium]|nr:glycosyltransferase [Candidatus Saccharimonadales bacterium]
MSEKLQKLNIALATHSRATGLSQMLSLWLQKRAKKLIFIDHPLPPAKKYISFCTVFEKGKVTGTSQTFDVHIPFVFIYFKDILLTFYFGFKNPCDIAIGVDNINAFSFILLKKIGKVKKVIYHTVDYTPKRFGNPVLNNIYHSLDRFCCYNADISWDSSSRMIEARVKNGVDKKRIAKIIITPDGSNFDPKKRLAIEKIERNTVVFLGHLRKGLGLELLIDSFADAAKQVAKAKLVIIGGGPLLESLKSQTKKLGIENRITFTGFIESHEKVDDILAKGAISIAMFEPVKDSLEYYSDVGKPKVYLAAGLPVIITKVPEIALEIEKRKAGIAISYDKKSLSLAIIKLLRSDALYRQQRKNAIELSKKYIWSNIFEQAFSQTLKDLKCI